MCPLVPFGAPTHCRDCVQFHREHQDNTRTWIESNLTGKRQHAALAHLNQAGRGKEKQS